MHRPCEVALHSASRRIRAGYIKRWHHGAATNVAEEEILSKSAAKDVMVRTFAGIYLAHRKVCNSFSL